MPIPPMIGRIETMDICIRTRDWKAEGHTAAPTLESTLSVSARSSFKLYGLLDEDVSLENWKE